MKVTDSTFEATECGAVETGCATVDGKKYCVMRIWEYCCCSYDYYCEYVILNECCGAAEPKKEEPKKEEEEEEKKEVKKDADEKHSAKKWRTGDVFTHRVPTSEDFFAEFGV